MRDLIFISYSHKDKKYLEEFQTMLVPLRRSRAVDVWDDTRIQPGARWRDEIEQALKKAKAALLVVSTNFLASDFIDKHELPPLLKAAKDDGLKVFWLCLDPCMYKGSGIEDFNAFLDPAKDLASMKLNQRKNVWRDLCEALKEIPPLSDVDDKPDLLTTANNLIVVLLQPSDAATRKLAARFSLDCSKMAECRKRVAEKTLNTPLDELFEIALEEQQSLITEGDSTGAGVIVRVVQAILPILHQSEDADAVRSSRATQTGVLHELHASHKTIAELIMAKVDGRPVAYARPGNPNEFPCNEAGLLPIPPEGGRDPTGQQFQRDFIEHLRETFTDPNKPPANDEALTYWIRDGMRRAVKRWTRPFLPVHCGFTHYFLIETPSKQTDEERAARNDAVINELAARFPEIAFLRLAPPDPLQRELQPYSLLIDLLYANPEPR